MKHRVLTLQDIETYAEDIFLTYLDNKLIFDSQNAYSVTDVDTAKVFLRVYVDSPESMVIGIFDNDEEHLYGIVIYDGIRICGSKSCAEAHIAARRNVWGMLILTIYKKLLAESIYTTIFCKIPTIAVHAIRIAKKLGFKKTGYIPDNLPYVNSRGEERMYDTIILTYRRDK